MWGHYMTGAAWWGMGLYMALFWLLVPAVIVALVIAATRLRSSSPGGVAHGQSALTILEERYARGEIGKEEFDQKKRDLLS
jgi:putative membrane protein